MSAEGLILVTGATGQQGGAVARELLAQGYKVRAMTRNTDSENAKALAGLGAELVRGDLDDTASLASAVEGAWGTFSMQNTWEAGVEREEEQGKLFAGVAREHGVQHFVYASVGSAHKQTGIPHFENKSRIEEKVLSAGFPSYTILRPVFFMENFLSPWFKPYILEGNLAVGIKPETKLQMIAVADIGKYGLAAFEQHEALNGRAIDIAGDEMMMPEAAKIISQASGKTVSHYQVPIEQVRESSEDFALMLEWFDAVGYSADVDGNAKEFGIAPTSFRDWANAVNWG
jgi:uncharacterized protein YbjT (DUF2867 family)